MYLDQLQSLQDTSVALEKRIAEIFSQFDSTLTSITGVGPVLGAVILSEIRDISCFPSADKLAANTGLNPKVKQSGDMKSSAQARLAISAQGNLDGRSHRGAVRSDVQGLL